MWCSAEFSSAITPVSHDPSEIILICWFIISVEIVMLLNIFFGTCGTFFFESLINKKFNIYSKYKYFLTMHVFTITFYPFILLAE